MILDKRQTKFSFLKFGEVERIEFELPQKFKTIKEKLSEAIAEKMDHEGFQKEIISDCVEQTLMFLVKENLVYLGENKKETILNSLQEGKIELWKEFINLGAFYEGVSLSLRTMLIKYHYPQIHKAMENGAVYSHYGLTIIGECVVYTLEYLKKKNILKENG
jgi:hypothetical protein